MIDYVVKKGVFYAYSEHEYQDGQCRNITGAGAVFRSGYGHDDGCEYFSPSGHTETGAAV